MSRHTANPTRPRKLLTFPGWMSDNPYLNVLYLSVRARGYVVESAIRLDPFLAKLRDLRRDDVVHVNWTAPIAQYASDEQGSWDAVSRFRAATNRAVRRGVRLIWTIHNRLPHELNYLDAELDLCRFLAERAEQIIVINPATEQAVADLYPLPPEKVRLIPHSSYAGLYPDTATREEARQCLGLAPDERGLLFFGQMRRYKGLNTFFEALSMLRERDDRIVMMLAGKTLPQDLAWVDASIPTHIKVIRDHTRVPDSDVQHWFRAADVVVLPYQAVLNSGTVYLCATFGCSVVLPRQPYLEAEFRDAPWIRFYELDDPARRLAEALSDSLEHRPDASAAARTFARTRPPFAMSLAFDRTLAAGSKGAR